MPFLHDAGLTLGMSLIATATATAAGGAWVTFTPAPERINAPSFLVADDAEEKDYAWGDVDKDGDTDLVIVRKEPFAATGRRRNVLLLNEDGVLTDRTAEYASASDVLGGEGFLTPTNDRDVVLVDVNGDDWLDIVTAVDQTDGQPKHLSHPRVYINLGETAGVWQGFRHEDARIPEMHPTAGPRFVSVSAGDVTGDGAVDLYFGDHDSGGAMVFDFNDRLLVNDGGGVFTDETTLRLTPEMYVSGYGARNEIADINNDGAMDIVRLTTLFFPIHVAVSYNDPVHTGVFTEYDVIYALSGYDFETGDLNGDGNLDLVVVDAGLDRTLLNQGPGADGLPDFLTFVLPPATGAAWPADVALADLDHDGWKDVLLASVDVEIPVCSDPGVILHHQADPPFVTFAEEGEPIPEEMLEGIHDIAPIDIDGDGWLDLVIGRCSGTEVWMNVPPAACPADVNGDRSVGVADLLLLLSAWGPCPDCDEDLDEDGVVGLLDLLALITAWGPCP